MTSSTHSLPRRSALIGGLSVLDPPPGGVPRGRTERRREHPHRRRGQHRPDTGEDTVTLDLQAPEKSSPYSDNPFRLTDIPVV